MKRILVFGASRGIGAVLVRHFSSVGYHVTGVSRSKASHCEWIKADVSTGEGIRTVVSQVGQGPIDALIYSTGIWEEHGFSEHFDFRKTDDVETRNIMSVNLVAPIEITKGVAANLAMSSNPRAIYLGALSGLDQISSEQVAYAASKFGLRGAIQGLRKALKAQKIGFTVINPGNVATDEVLLDIEEGRFEQQEPIPISDIIKAIDMILSLSSGVEVGDINLIQKN